MSFIFETKVSFIHVAPALGGLAIDRGETEKLNITYAAARLDYLMPDNRCGMVFDISVDGAVTKGSLLHEFAYSGTGNPFEEAERSLKIELHGL